MDPKKQVREFLVQRQLSYKRTFNKENADVTAVLKDLARFCRATESCFHADPRAHALIEGRREVYLRILAHLDLSPTEFLEKYNMEDKV